MKKRKSVVPPVSTSPAEDDRLAVLHEHIPQLFTTPARVLYVGACQNRHDLVPELKAAGHEITVLEIWPDYVEWLCTRRDLFDHVICGDVRNVDVLVHDRFEFAIWWHGPEHMVERDLPGVFAKLEGMAPMVILGCPWGVFAQDSIDGNPAQAHVSALLPEFFQALGYQTVTTGKRDTWGSGITAWK